MKSFININRNEWLQIVFSHRNQQYGAFVLRKENDRNHLKALSWVILALVVGVSSFYVKNTYFTTQIEPDFSSKNTVERIIEMDITPKTDIEKPKPIEKNKVQTQKSSSTSSSLQVKSTRFTSPKVVDNPKNTQVPTMDDLRKSAIAHQNIDGIAIETNALPKGNSNGRGEGGGGNASEGTQTVFNEVEVYPEFLGGKAAWGRFLSQNLQYPSDANESGISGKVILQFVIETDGHLSAIKVIQSLNKSCDEAAISALKKSPRWRPGFQNGIPVRVRYSIPIHFHIE